MSIPQFPEGFLVGAATASYQIEGAVAEGGRGPSIWDTYSHTLGKIDGGDTGDVAADHYHRWEADLDLIAEMGLDSYRFSIAWPRIQPTGSGALNQAGVDFYSRLVDGLRARDITPMATLYHWDLPQALQDAGGWVSRDTSYRFADYAAIMGEALGDRVGLWTTLNEPWCAAFLGYGAGVQAPGHTSGLESLQAAHHLNLAHGLGLQRLRETVPVGPQFSVVLNLHAIRGKGARAAEAKRRAEAVGNRIFSGPMLAGGYPPDLLEDTASFCDWSFVQPGDEASIHQPLDLLGLNYYTTGLVRMARRWPLKAKAKINGTAWPGAEGLVSFLAQFGPETLMGWTIDPAGLEMLVRAVAREFPGLDLMITENGAAYADVVSEDGQVHDEGRTDYLRQHLEVVAKLAGEGIPLRGYQAWSLLDNFEWSYGYEKRFGVVRVDYDTQERTIKDSGRYLAEVARAPRLRATDAPHDAGSQKG